MPVIDKKWLDNLLAESAREHEEVVLTLEEQHAKALKDAYDRGYQEGLAAGNNYSWRL